MASGKVHARCFRRHRHEQFFAFLNSLVRRYLGREIHVIWDNYATRKHPAVVRWLEAHPRFHLHLTPTVASWAQPDRALVRVDHGASDPPH